MSASNSAVSQGSTYKYLSLDDPWGSYRELQSDIARYLTRTANATIAGTLEETFWNKIAESGRAMHQGFTLTKQEESLTLDWIYEADEPCSMSFNMDGTVKEDQSEGTQVVSGNTDVPVAKNGVETNGWQDSTQVDDDHVTPNSQ